MKHQVLFSSKDKSKKKSRLLRFLFGALRVKALMLVWNSIGLADLHYHATYYSAIFDMYYHVMAPINTKLQRNV